MNINEFNNILSKLDSEKLDDLKFNSNYLKKYYLPYDNYMFLNVTNMNKEKFTVDVEWEEFNGCKFVMDKKEQKEIPVTGFVILPTHIENFKDYKKQLIVIKFENEKFFEKHNQEIYETIINNFKEVSLSEKDIETMLSETDYVIHDQETKLNVLYTKNKEFVTQTKNEIYKFDSLDPALKPIYETIKDFRTKESKKRLKEFKEYLDSEEGIESVNDLIKEIRGKEKESADFMKSDKYFELKNTIFPEKMAEIGDIYYSDILYSNIFDGLTEIDEINLFIKTLFSEYEPKVENDAVFPTDFITTEKFVVKRICGQGTEYLFKLI